MSELFNQLTPDAVRCLDVAVDTVRLRHYHYVDIEHLLIGALQTDLVRNAMVSTGVPADSLLQALYAELSMVRETPLDEIKGLAQDAKQSLADAAILGRKLGVDYINSGHIALSILQKPSPFLAEILDKFPQLDIDQVQTSIVSNSNPPTSSFRQNWKPAKWETAKYLGVDISEKRRNATVTVRPASVQRKRSQPNSQNQALFIGLGILAMVVYGAIIAPGITVPVVIVVGGWIISLILHEFSHALVAFWGGDHTVVEKGYLTMNPLKYVHPLTSIGLPLLFLALGGIGLPGGAVYIERHRLRNKWWGSAVSAAGPMANIICLIVFSAPFWTGLAGVEQFVDRPNLWGSIAFLCWLQVTAIIFNLIPVPPLDGFGIIEPFLEERLAVQLRSLGSIGLFLIIMLFWIPPSDSFNFAGEFFSQVDAISEQVEVPQHLSICGFYTFRFWDQEQPDCADMEARGLIYHR
jgi:Zn-dependent protease